MDSKETYDQKTLNDELEHLNKSIDEIKNGKSEDRIYIFEQKKLLDKELEVRDFMRSCEAERLEQRKQLIETRLKYNTHN